MLLKGSGNSHTKKDLYINGHTCLKQFIPASDSGSTCGSVKPLVHNIDANIAIVKKRKKEKKS